MTLSGWVGVDFDGTLVTMPGEAPIAPMVDLVKRWLAAGLEVRIVTARVSPQHGEGYISEQTAHVQWWCSEHLGQALAVQAHKDFAMIALFDDSCCQVEKNTGKLLGTERHGLCEY
jgi:hypothetical protein